MLSISSACLRMTASCFFLVLLLACELCQAAGWRVDTVVPAGLSGPTGVAVDAAGNVYVVDTYRNAVHTYAGSPTTGYLRQKDVAFDLLYPTGVAVDRAGNVYVAEADANTVRSYSGSPTTGYARQKDVATGLASPAGVAVDAAGNVYVADANNNTVRTYSGSPTGGYTRQKDVATDLASPNGVAVDGAGDVFVADTNHNTVHSYSGSPSAGYAKQKDIGSSLVLPIGVAVDNAGVVYVAESFRAIRTYSGSPTAGYAQQKDVAIDMSYVIAMAVDRNGNVYASDNGYNVVHTYSGSPTAGYTQQKDVVMGLHNPLGVAVDSTRHVYVADTGNDAVRVYSGSPATGYVSQQDIAGLRGAAGVAVDGAGNLFVASRDGRQVYIYSGSPATGYTKKRDLTTDWFRAPWGVALDGAGNVYMTDCGSAAVYVYSGSPASGYTRQKQIGSGLQGPTGIAVDKEGNVYVVDSGGTMHTVHTYSGSLSAGYIQQQDVAADFKNPVGVAVDNAGHVYVADAAEVTLRRYSGSPKTGFTRQPDVLVGSAANAPLGLTVDGAGNLYMTAGNLDLTDSTNAVSKLTAIADVSLITSVASAVHGAAQLTATVTVGNTSTPTGSVSFCDGGAATDATFCATGRLLACSPAALSGTTATCGTADLAVGTHAITARYSGDANNAASVSAALALTVTQAVTTTSVAPQSVFLGSGAMLAAAVSATPPATGQPTGSVTIQDTTDNLSCSYMLAAATPGCVITAPTAGVKTLIASYSGDANFAASNGTGTLSVNAVETGTTLAVAPSPSTYGQNVTLTATVGQSSEGPNPTGTVTFLDGNTVLGSSAIADFGKATFTTNVLSVGTHTLVARYGGNAPYAGSSGSASHVVLPASSSITLNIAPSPSTVGQAVALLAKVGSSSSSMAQPQAPASAVLAMTGTVSFTDNSAALATVAVDGNSEARYVTSALSVGSHAITATYSGDASHGPASATQSHQVNAVPTATVQAPALTVWASGLLFALLAGAGLGYVRLRRL